MADGLAKILQALAGHAILSLAGDTSTQSQFPELATIPPVRDMTQKEGTIIPIIGAPEGGKTVMAYRLAEILGRPTFAYSPAVRPKFSWVTRLKSLDDVLNKKVVPRGSVVILDDVLSYASSKDYTDPSVRKLEKIIPEARHKRKIIFIICTQVSSLTDKYLLTGPCVFLKQPSILFSDLERPAVVKLQKMAEPYFAGKSDWFLQRHAYCIAHRYKGLVFIQYPSDTAGWIVPEDTDDDEEEPKKLEGGSEE